MYHAREQKQRLRWRTPITSQGLSSHLSNGIFTVTLQKGPSRRMRTEKETPRSSDARSSARHLPRTEAHARARCRQRAQCREAVGGGPGGFPGWAVNAGPGKRPRAQGNGHATSPGTYDELGVPPHGDDRPVHCPEKLLHDDLDVPLGGALWEDTGREPTPTAAVSRHPQQP